MNGMRAIFQKKRRISNKIKGNAGEPLGLPPYGYIRNLTERIGLLMKKPQR